MTLKDAGLILHTMYERHIERLDHERHWLGTLSDLEMTEEALAVAAQRAAIGVLEVEIKAMSIILTALVSEKAVAI